MLNFHSHVALYQTCDFHCILCINTLSLDYVVPIGMTYLNLKSRTVIACLHLVGKLFHVSM